jgi:hypothetical protein
MRKVFPFLISGLLAVSFSQIAAAQSASTHDRANASADMKADTGAKSTDSSSTSAIGGSSTGSSSGAGGATADTSKADRTHANKGKHKGAAKNKKHKDMDKQSSTTKSGKDTTAAGSTSSSSKSKTDSSAAAGGSASLPTKPDTSAAPAKSDSSVKSGAQSPQKSEKSD